MPASGLTVYMVEDDQSVRDSLGLLLGLKGYSVAPFVDAESFLAAHQPSWRGCLLLDLRMPGLSGLELQQRLKAEDCALPVVIMTGHGSVEAAREAFRSDAIDFLEKPLDHGRLVTAIDEALHQAVGKFENQQRRDDLERQLAVLTPREREVMGRVVAGEHNRDIAKALNISPRTVEVHKGRMMSKLGVSSVPDLVKLNLGHGPIR